MLDPLQNTLEARYHRFEPWQCNIDLVLLAFTELANNEKLKLVSI